MKILTALCVTALALAACGGEQAPAAVPTPSAPKKKVEAAAPAIVSTVEYVYSPIGKRDPFRNLAIDNQKTDPTTNSSENVVCSEPLCQFDLDELSVVAVVSGDANPLAMLEDRTGVGHIVRRNTKIGRQGGKVTQVLRDCIVVTSFVTGADGKAQPNKQNMCVRPDQGSAPVLDLLDGKLRQ
jgi:type IV pilus assembly protein PilP